MVRRRAPLIAAAILVAEVAVGSWLLPSATWQASHGPRAVNLWEPGVIEALRRSNPQRFSQVAQTIDLLGRVDIAELRALAHQMKRVSSVDVGPALLASYPPKRHVSFAVEEVVYSAVATVRYPDRPRCC
jgi:hypothetical protein